MGRGVAAYLFRLTQKPLSEAAMRHRPPLLARAAPRLYDWEPL